MKLSEIFSFRQMAINEILKNIAADGSTTKYATSLILSSNDHRESVAHVIEQYLTDDPDPRITKPLEDVLRLIK